MNTNLFNIQNKQNPCIYNSDGSRYEGNWVFGKKSGKGTFYYPNGNRYEGDWTHDRKNGT